MSFLDQMPFKRLQQDGAREIDDLLARRIVRLPGEDWDARPRPVSRPRRSIGQLGFLPMILAGIVIGVTAPDWWPGLTGSTAPLTATGGPRAAPGDTESARFGTCWSGGGTNCVVDGDTFWYQGGKIRIADIDTPETHPARCAEEQRLGDAATVRLHALLNAGPFSLESIGRDTDRYGRQLRVVTRGGTSLGGVLVREGLARQWGGARQPWC